MRKKHTLSETEITKFYNEMTKIQLRLSNNKRAEWKQKAANLNMTMTDFIIAAVDKIEMKPRKRSHVDPLFLQEIARIGNNINQIARYANSLRELADATKILSVLIAIENDLAAIRLSFDMFSQVIQDA